jgi:hypothetical protein
MNSSLRWKLLNQLRGSRTRRFITAFTTVRHRSLSYPIPVVKPVVRHYTAGANPAPITESRNPNSILISSYHYLVRNMISLQNYTMYFFILFHVLRCMLRSCFANLVEYTLTKLKLNCIIQVHNHLSEILETEKLRKPKVFSWRSTPT